MSELSVTNSANSASRLYMMGGREEASFINCVVDTVDESFPIEKKVHFGILGRPIIKGVQNQTGEVTAYIRRAGEISEVEYKIYYRTNQGWDTITHKRLGIPMEVSEIIDELVWLVPTFVSETVDEDGNSNCFDHFLAEELIERLKYFRNHVKLAERYRAAATMVRFDDI